MLISHHILLVRHHPNTPLPAPVTQQSAMFCATNTKRLQINVQIGQDKLDLIHAEGVLFYRQNE